MLTCFLQQSRNILFYAKSLSSGIQSILEMSISAIYPSSNTEGMKLNICYMKYQKRAEGALLRRYKRADNGSSIASTESHHILQYCPRHKNDSNTASTAAGILTSMKTNPFETINIVSSLIQKKRKTVTSSVITRRVESKVKVMLNVTRTQPKLTSATQHSALCNSFRRRKRSSRSTGCPGYSG